MSSPNKRRPILDRLVPSTVIQNVDSDRNMPSIGASLEVPDRSSDGGRKTVWLTAQAWEGVMMLIVQTPDRYRPAVAEFLELVQADLATSSPLELLLTEIIDEIRTDPCAELPQTPIDTYDFSW